MAVPPSLSVNVGVPVTVTASLRVSVSVTTSPGFSVPLPGEATTCVTAGVMVSIWAPTWVSPESVPKLAAVPAPFLTAAPFRLIAVAASEFTF